VTAAARLAVVVALCLLGGCAARGPAPAADDALARGLDAFTVDGKVAWRHPEDDGRASVHWVQRDPRSRLVVAGPFGAGAAVLEAGRGDAVLVAGDVRRAGRDAGALLEAALGLPLPVAAARWWVLGVPAPGRHRMLEADEAGRPRAFEQRGWTVRVVRRTAVDGLALPQRLDMRRGEVELRFVATRWQPGVAVFPPTAEAAPGG
jgi:outer membrane lipoprotein LolB